MKKAFSDIFTSVAGVTIAVLLVVSAVLCGTALTAFEISVENRLLTAAAAAVPEYDLSGGVSAVLNADADAVAFYGADGFALFKSGTLASPDFIAPGELQGARLPELSTFLGNFHEPVFYSVTPKSGGYLLLADSTAFFGSFVKRVLLIAAVTVILGICLVLVVVYFMAKRFISPIEEITTKAAQFESGDFAARISITGDSEIGYLADSLNRMAATIEQTENDRNAFIANVSHELRTPMTTISGFIDGVLDGTIVPEEQGKFLRLVSNETKRLSRLVTNMLSLSSFDAGKMSIVKHRFDVLPEFLTVLTHFADEINRKNITVNAPESEEFFINGDADLLGQVIFNLVENAVKFTEEGGSITISFAEAYTENAVRIRNTGGGLRSDEITKVFERFYKADESRGKDKYGAGLGLSIVSSIIKLHAGKLIVRSEPEKFTEFEITLPNA
jgi:signal transduction histidine kinase